MKYLPYFLSVFGFFLTIIFYFLLEQYISVDWIIYNYYGNVSADGTRFEAEIAWLPLLITVLVSYFGWKIGKRIGKRKQS